MSPRQPGAFTTNGSPFQTVTFSPHLLDCTVCFHVSPSSFHRCTFISASCAEVVSGPFKRVCKPGWTSPFNAACSPSEIHPALWSRTAGLTPQHLWTGSTGRHDKHGPERGNGLVQECCDFIPQVINVCVCLFIGSKSQIFPETNTTRLI